MKPTLTRKQIADILRELRRQKDVYRSSYMDGLLKDDAVIKGLATIGMQCSSRSLTAIRRQLRKAKT